MESVTTQKDLADFFKNPENAQEVNGLVEDIRSALIDYQVRAPKIFLTSYLTSVTDVVTVGYL